MKNSIFSVKGRRGKIFAAITVSGIAVIFVLNLLLTYLGLNKTIFIDMTEEGFYTLTDKMQEEIRKNLVEREDLDKSVEITFCADPDTLMADTVMRVTYVMALKLANKFNGIDVKTVNVNLNPTAVAEYKTTSLTQINSSDVIVSYGEKYRIAGGESFWTTTSSNELWSYNGEYKMMSMILSLTSHNQPAAYFITNNGTTYFDPDSDRAGNADAEVLYNLLLERGLSVKTLDISAVEAIPDDCVLLILNNPTEDFEHDPDQVNSFSYVSDLEKIDRYLTKGNGSLMVTNDYALRNPDGTKKELTNLKAFLREWGFEFSDERVDDANNCLPLLGNTSAPAFAPIVGVYETNENSYGNAIYGDYAASATSPRMIFTDTGYITCAFGLSDSIDEPGSENVNRYYDSFIKTSSEAIAYAYNDVKGEYADRATLETAFTLAAICSRQFTHEYDATTTYSYVFCANSKDFLSNELLGNASYANFDIVSALINNMIRTDIHASTDLGGISFNSTSFGGKQILDNTLYEYETEIWSEDANAMEPEKVNAGITESIKTTISVVVFTIPAVIAVLGIVICLKRKFL